MRKVIVADRRYYYRRCTSEAKITSSRDPRRVTEKERARARERENERDRQTENKRADEKTTPYYQ
jgi:hypothetical protein